MQHYFGESMSLVLSVKGKRISEAKLQLREKLWPNLDEKKLWSRKQKKGFTTIPRTMPIILKIMDVLSKGKPVSATYLALWCHVFDENMVVIPNPNDMAYEVGFGGKRAESTWLSRMKILHKLGFIDCKEGPSGDFHYVLIWNPYAVIAELHASGKIDQLQYRVLYHRSQTIGADDLEEIK